jgi:hypothetical protein
MKKATLITFLLVLFGYKAKPKIGKSAKKYPLFTTKMAAK